MRPPRLLLIAFICAIAPGSLMLAPRAGAYQHVTNGSFEDGMSGWGVSGSTTPSIVSEGASDGTHAMRVEEGSRVRIAQQIGDALAPGQYTLTFAARASNGSGSVTTSVHADGSDLALVQATEPVTSGSAAIEYTFTASRAIETDITLWIVAPADGAITIDDVRIDGADPVTFTPTATATTLAPTATPATGTITPTTVPVSPTPQAIALPVTADIRNGGFEDLGDGGAPIGWEQYGGALTSSTDARTGAHAARIESATDSTKWMHQAVTVSGGATYAFSAWMQHNDPSVARALLRVSWYASIDGSGSNIGSEDSDSLDAPAAGYRFLTTGPITAPPDARSARVRVLLAPASAAPAAILVDDASWGPGTPLPPTVVADATSPTTSGNAPLAATPQRSRASGGRSRTASGVVSGVGAAPPAASRIVINEVLYDAAGDGADADGEWVELYNAGTAPADLAGWLLADSSSADVLPSFVLEPGGYVVVAASDSISQLQPELAGRVVVLGGRIGNGLGNDGDTLLLVAPDGTWIDAVSWGDDASALNPSIDDVPEGHSIERSTAGLDTGRASDFTDNASPSPGGPIGTAPPRSQPESRPRVEILAGDGATFAWLPWAIAVASLAALAGVASWRAIDLVRHRVRP